MNALSRPFPVKITNWYGFLLAATFLLYGGVNVILSVLDRQSEGLGAALIFGAVGIVLVSFAEAYRERRRWGWIGMIATNILVVVLSFFNLRGFESYVLLALAAGAVALLFSSPVREYLGTSAKN